MSDLDERLASLTPEKRRLLELRLERAGLPTPTTAPRQAVPLPEAPETVSGPPSAVEVSLFFFSADGSAAGTGHKYRLLLEAARFADRHGFAAVWTPERHFQDFGGLYPNPAVLGAALAVATENVEIRAGSVVVPLHHPVRIAEEWSVVDNLSGGRAAISCATGWHPTDFIVRPESYADRREIMFRTIGVLRKLWAGEAVEFATGDGGVEAVRSLPRPVRRELPIWVTSSGNADTWRRAGEVGANLLTSLGSQPFEDLEKKVRLYRRAYRRNGEGPPGAAGTVSVMLHTFLGDDLEAAREQVREPLSDYLRTHMRQRDSFMDLPAITEADKEALIPLAYAHYVEKAALIGTVASASPLVDRLAAAGVDEIACLIDFGLAHDEVMASLEHLAELARRHRGPREADHE